MLPTPYANVSDVYGGNNVTGIQPFGYVRFSVQRPAQSLKEQTPKRNNLTQAHPQLLTCPGFCFGQGMDK